MEEAILKLERNPDFLSLKGIKFENSEQFNFFLNSLKNCLPLETLKFENCRFTENTLNQLMEALIDCPTLSSIFLQKKKSKDLTKDKN